MRANLCEERLKPEAPGTEPFFGQAADYFGAAAWVQTGGAESEVGSADKSIDFIQFRCGLDAVQSEFW